MFPMDKQRYLNQNSIEFVVQKTGLSTDTVEKLSGVEIPGYWVEWLKAIVDNYNKPGTLALHEKMIKERENFVKGLSADEIWEIQEIKAVDEYLERLMSEGAVEKGTASIFANAQLEWYLRVQEAVIDLLSVK